MISIAAFPEKGEPYTECFYDSLRTKGIIINDGDFSGRWILKNWKTFNYFHFHWPSFFYADRNSTRNAIKNIIRFSMLLFLIRLSGSKILWTAHNLYPHDKSRPFFIDKAARRIIICLSYKIFVHGNSAAQILKREFKSAETKIVIIDHGNWVDCYENKASRNKSRKKIGVASDSYIYLFIGFVKEYKNILFLIETFKKITDGTLLLIAGKYQDKNYYERVITAARYRKNNIVIDERYIPDNELQYYLNACNVVVLPYTEILTSGAAMLAISFGRPVIAPRQGYLKELINPECGILYNPRELNGLLNALNEVQKKQFDEKRIIKHAMRFNWDNIAEIVVKSI